jgi:phospholipid-binding lipoprotein MlaA
MNATFTSLFRKNAVLVLTAFVASLTGCMTTGKNQNDPWEGLNRATFAFNEKVDGAVVAPVAKAYKATMPDLVQVGVNNFFGNIGDLSTALNDLLQARFADSMSDMARIVINTTFGLVGLIDVATPAFGLEKHDQDFGQTLGRWGVASGPYLVLPFFGPSTARDAAALPVDLETDLWSYKRPVDWRNVGTALRLVDKRANLLAFSDLVDDAAIDKYEFVRDAYLQRRKSKIFIDEKSETDSASDHNNELESEPAPESPQDSNGMSAPVR